MTMSQSPTCHDFAEFIIQRWRGDFQHCYNISKHRSWATWRRHHAQENNGTWSCNSLQEAAERYSWPENAEGQDFVSLSKKLRAQQSTRDEEGIAQTCLEIFKWGGVARKKSDTSLCWVIKQKEAGQLSQNLADARNILVDTDSSLERFNRRDLLMNSAMTKVYAALDPKRLVIYDGRVGAALGLLAKNYLHSINYCDELPTHLAFAWGASSRKYQRGRKNERNPSDETFKFPPLFGQKRDMRHAQMMATTSNLLCQVSRQISKNNHSLLPDLEKALFMVGYDVSRQL